MKVSIVGTGAIGGFYGIMLANAGHDVHFLLRSGYERVKKNGHYLSSAIYGNISLPKVNAYNKDVDMPKSDIILVALKTTQNLDQVPAILSNLADEDSLVVLIQNGLGMEQGLSNAMPQLQIAGGLALITSYEDIAGRIIHQDHGDLDFGGFNLGNAAMLDILVLALNKTGLRSSNQN